MSGLCRGGRVRSGSDAYEGRGGQQLLLERLPFCPARDCPRHCGHLDCTCRPCRCGTCRARRGRRATGTPDLMSRFAPAPYQPTLFPIRRTP